MDLEEKLIKSNLIYDGRILQLYNDEVELPGGKRSRREYVNHSGGCAVLAVDDEGYIYLVEQYRYPYAEVMLEIPAGKRNRDEIYVYLAHGLKATQAHLDEGEFLNVRRIPFTDALKKVMDMEIRDSKTVAAILKYALIKGIKA